MTRKQLKLPMSNALANKAFGTGAVTVLLNELMNDRMDVDFTPQWDEETGDPLSRFTITFHGMEMTVELEVVATHML